LPMERALGRGNFLWKEYSRKNANGGNNSLL
jgi:hypothetical protein